MAPSPNASRPSFFDISGRAKWDAWKLAAETYEGRPSDAELRYLDIARSLGWKEGSPSTTTAATAAATEETEEPAERSGGGGTGMGVSVSVMSQPPEDEEAMGLHSYAMGDDVAALSAFLQASQDPDVDARDEYVSIFIWRHLPRDRFSFLRQTNPPFDFLQGYTALHLAADRGNISAVGLLLKHGADKTLKVSALTLSVFADYSSFAIRIFSQREV